MENFNAKEILEIAIQNEKNGITFYTNLSRQVENPSVKEALTEFIRQEHDHIRTIRELINDLLEGNGELDYYDDPEELLYLQAIAGTSVFKDAHDEEYLSEVFTDILAAMHYAVSIEIKSIEFYKQLLQLMAPGSGQEKIGELIDQEKGHVKKLYSMIKDHKDKR